jgi:hypothetical protein
MYKDPEETESLAHLGNCQCFPMEESL